MTGPQKALALDPSAEAVILGPRLEELYEASVEIAPGLKANPGRNRLAVARFIAAVEACQEVIEP